MGSLLKLRSKVFIPVFSASIEVYSALAAKATANEDTAVEDRITLH
jgi:hypothetical protein